jgi:ferritin-like metal-binding protein YciE
MLQKAFEDHLRETENQVMRIEKAAEVSNLKLKREKCEALEGLVTESKEIIHHVAEGPLLDAARIMGAQKIDHYEISGYGSLCELAEQLGFSEAARLLGETLDEEKGADERLSALAKNGINQQAQAYAA